MQKIHGRAGTATRVKSTDPSSRKRARRTQQQNPLTAHRPRPMTRRLSGTCKDRVAAVRNCSRTSAASSQRLTMCDPLRGQLLLRCVLRQARIERREINLVDRLVLVEAGKDIAQLAADRIAVRLQALRADF